MPLAICKAMVTIPPQPWPTGLAEDVEPLVRRVLAPNPSPYTFTGTQTYVVGAADGPDCAVIDPGPDEPDHIEAKRRSQRKPVPVFRYGNDR